MSENKWYFSLWFLAIAVFLLGPLAIPLIWANPRLSLWLKIAITLLVIIMFVWFLYLSAEIVKSILVDVEELKKAMR